jgi:hypothetical protein
MSHSRLELAPVPVSVARGKALPEVYENGELGELSGVRGSMGTAIACVLGRASSPVRRWRRGAALRRAAFRCAIAAGMSRSVCRVEWLRGNA